MVGFLGALAIREDLLVRVLLFELRELREDAPVRREVVVEDEALLDKADFELLLLLLLVVESDVPLVLAVDIPEVPLFLRRGLRERRVLGEVARDGGGLELEVLVRLAAVVEGEGVAHDVDEGGLLLPGGGLVDGEVFALVVLEEFLVR